MKDIKVGAVNHPDKDVIAIVFEFSGEKFIRMVDLSVRNNKSILANMFNKHVPPLKVLKALLAGIKALRRDAR